MKPIVGIDIGKRFVKVVQLEKKLSLTKCCIFSTPYTKNGDLDVQELIKHITSCIPLNLLKKSQIGVNLFEPFGLPNLQFPYLSGVWAL